MMCRLRCVWRCGAGDSRRRFSPCRRGGGVGPVGGGIPWRPTMHPGSPAAEKSGQFELRNWADAYLRDGHFDQDRMLALIQEVLDGGIEQGFALTRLVAHMEWALEDRPGVDDLVEYETRLNYVLPRYKDPVI